MAIYCPKCGFDNSDERAACLMCLTYLAEPGGGQTCSECGHDNPAGASFCRECGAQLDATATRVPSRQDLVAAAQEALSGELVGAAAEEEEEFGALGAMEGIGEEEEVEAITGPGTTPAEVDKAPLRTPEAIEEEEEIFLPTGPTPGTEEPASVVPPPPPPVKEELPPPPPPPGLEEEEELPVPPLPPDEEELLVPPPPPPAVEATAEAEDLTALIPPPPPPGVGEEELAEEAAPPGSIEISEGEEDEFAGWELDLGDDDE